MAEGLQGPRSEHARHILCAERGIAKRKRCPHEGVCLNARGHLVAV
jgi:hypothetical protein